MILNSKILILLLLVINLSLYAQDDLDYTYKLFTTVEGGNYAEVLEIVDSIYGNDYFFEGVNVTKNTKTPLMVACQKGYLDIAKLLLTYDADDSIKNKHGNTALHFAAYNKHNQIVKLLLHNYAYKDEKGYWGQTPLHLATEAGNEEAIKILISYGADTEIKDNDRNTPLMIAKKNGKQNLVTLIEKQIKAFSLGEKYSNEFINAVEAKNYSVVKKYIDKGIDVNLSEVRENEIYVETYGSALRIAAQNNDEKMVKLLIDAGADTDIITSEARSGFHMPITPLNSAISHNNINLVSLLIKTGCRLYMNQGLFITSNIEIIKLLMDSGVDVNIVFNGYTPLHKAVSKNEIEIVKLLLNSKADPNSRVRQYHFYRGYEGFTGDTPLMWAAKYGYLDIVKVLVEVGADVNIKNSEVETPFMAYDEDYSGYTALRYAEENGHTDVAKYLKSKGAE